MEKNENIIVLGQRINNITLVETLDEIHKAIKSNECLTIATVNPEFLVLATRNKRFRNILSAFDLRVPDGVGILYLTNIFTRNRFRERVTGVELSEKLIKLCANNSYKVALIGGSSESNKKACEKLLGRCPALSLYGNNGGTINPNTPPEQLISEIKAFKPHVTLVALGAPKQEYFINNIKNDIKSVYVGVGGTIDFMAGTAYRAPSFFRKIGLEWLWRLFFEPKRFKRIINATLVFPAYYIKNVLLGNRFIKQKIMFIS
jgi:N-acetylglucosaminyldiphosphoundecaprenol N-acetyl-beta-D-mannosaminyltransferase